MKSEKNRRDPEGWTSEVLLSRTPPSRGQEGYRDHRSRWDPEIIPDSGEPS